MKVITCYIISKNVNNFGKNYRITFVLYYHIFSIILIIIYRGQNNSKSYKLRVYNKQF